MKESEYFEFVTLAQVPANISKTTTYFAKLRGSNEVVFVKGPLKETFDPCLFLEIQLIKKALGLPIIQYRYTRLEPDITTIHSYRSNMKSRDAWFVYCKPLFDFTKYYDLCNLKKIDWSFINDVQHMKQSHKHRIDFKNTKAFREIFGIDDSDHLKNFLIKNDIIYSVDEDRAHCDINNVKSLLARRFIHDHKIILSQQLDSIVIPKLKNFVQEILRL